MIGFFRWALEQGRVSMSMWRGQEDWTHPWEMQSISPHSGRTTAHFKHKLNTLIRHNYNVIMYDVHFFLKKDLILDVFGVCFSVTLKALPITVFNSCRRCEPNIKKQLKLYPLFWCHHYSSFY